MGADEHQVVLYDFLFRDMDRVSSYYVQLFQGRLTATEESTSSKTAEDKGAKLNIPVAAADIKHSSEVSNALKRISDPHDVITTDVMSFLMTNGHINDDVEDASHGSLIIGHGTINFADKTMFELGMTALRSATQPQVPRKSKGTISSQQDSGLMAMFDCFLKVGIPSAYQIDCGDGNLIAGTINESGMQEPINTYYYRHGEAGLSDVYLIGIKELPAETSTFSSGAEILSAPKASAEALRGLLLPVDALRVTPIALFRKLI